MNKIGQVLNDGSVFSRAKFTPCAENLVFSEGVSVVMKNLNKRFFYVNGNSAKAWPVAPIVFFRVVTPISRLPSFGAFMAVKVHASIFGAFLDNKPAEPFSLARYSSNFVRKSAFAAMVVGRGLLAAYGA